MANGGTAADVGLGAPQGWWLARQVALVAFVAVIVGLFAWPETTLPLLWRTIIPLVPASLLVSPLLWRNVCPLATLNKLPASGRRTLSARAQRVAGAVGIVLLGVLVTLRHTAFNGFNPSDGAVLGVVVVAVAALALVAGGVFDSKAGFCNAICPLLPVERLYGQVPLVRVDNPRCVPCTRCTAVGCLDLARERAVPQLLAQSGRPWFLTGTGAFACAFPGFVLGYYLVDDGPLATTPHVFLVVGAWTLLSLVVAAGLARVLDLRANVALPGLAALAATVYYWFAAPVIGRSLGVHTAGGAVALRAMAFALVALWLWNALARRAV